VHITVINPNTAGAITDTIVAAARAVALSGVEISGTNPTVGVASVESHSEEAWATMGILAEIERAEAPDREPDQNQQQRRSDPKPDAFVIACFGDTGIDAAREAATVPVVGMTEAALFVAATVAHRFTIVTMPTRTIAQSERVVRSLGLGHRCTVRAVDVPVSDLVAGSAHLLPIFAAEARQAMSSDGAEAIILGCAGLADLVEPLGAELGIPVIEGVAAAVSFAAGLVAQRLSTSRSSTFAAVPTTPSARELLR
jgi:allantoin racemase